jgi:hypothetical protein
MGRILVLGALAVMVAAPTAVADERADWGTVVSVGAPAGSAAMLLQNPHGWALVAVDPFGTIVANGGGHMTYGDVRPGDRVDYQVTTWAGMDIVDVLHVTPLRHARVAP